MRVDELKYLGVTIDCRLSWNRHVEEVVASAEERFIGRVFGPGGRDARVLAFNGLVRPVLEYASAA